jgi:hypothetical protein
MVWVDRTAVGRMTVSTPMAEMMGRATVVEHLPRQEISWIVSILFIILFSFHETGVRKPYMECCF